MFDLCDREGLSPYQIGARLNEMGKRTASGKEWDWTVIEACLHNPAYIGLPQQFGTTRAKYTAFDPDGYIVPINNQKPKRRSPNISAVVPDQPIFPQ